MLRWQFHNLLRIGNLLLGGISIIIVIIRLLTVLIVRRLNRVFTILLVRLLLLLLILRLVHVHAHDSDYHCSHKRGCHIFWLFVSLRSLSLFVWQTSPETWVERFAESSGQSLVLAMNASVLTHDPLVAQHPNPKV